MQAYRDQYASVFNDGEGVTLIGVSYDPAEDLASWAQEDEFPFLFGSDPDGSVYRAFGAEPRGNGMVGSRAVIVIDPEGKVSHVMPRFNQVDPKAYDELAAAIDAASGAGAQAGAP